jgi:hypothetical protein
MIIFDLDGTLANCEHRRHFVDPSYRDDCYFHTPATHTQSEGWFYKDRFKMCEPPKPMKFIPDWHAFYEACDKDSPILPTISIFNLLWENRTGDGDVVIWSGRCESVREKTEKWLYDNLHFGETWPHLQMRPIGDNIPDDQLKEKWLNEDISKGETIEMVFDDRPKVVRMWRKNGIFVFDVNQMEQEF